MNVPLLVTAPATTPLLLSIPPLMVAPVWFVNVPELTTPPLIKPKLVAEPPFVSVLETVAPALFVNVPALVTSPPSTPLFTIVDAGPFIVLTKVFVPARVVVFAIAVSVVLGTVTSVR